MGYKISNYGGVEGGLSYFSTIRYDTNGVATLYQPSARVRDFDLLGAGYIPLRGGFELFGKGGVAITYETTSSAFNNGNSNYQTKFRPTISLGISYDITPSWVADLSVNRLMVGGIIKNVDMLAFGISYHFVDRYCCQFLCDN